jgi:hypothetical protein
MKVTVERAELLKSLGHVHRVVERRNTIPILANVLVKADRGKLSLKATDLDLEVTDSTAAEVSPGGSTTVPAHMFYDIVRKLPDGAQIVLEGSGDRAVLSLRAGRSRFTLQTLPESDFPDLAAGDMSHSFKLAAADLKRPDRQDSICDLDRGNALLPQRHLSAHRRHREVSDLARGGNRWTPPCPGGSASAAGRRGNARHHRAAQGGWRSPAPDRNRRRRRRD